MTASDNEYVAAIALMSPSGSKVYRAVAGNQTERGAQMEALVSLEGLPSRFLVAVYDYAMNVSTYAVDLGASRMVTGPTSRPSTGPIWTTSTGSAGSALGRMRTQRP